MSQARQQYEDRARQQHDAKRLRRNVLTGLIAVVLFGLVMVVATYPLIAAYLLIFLGSALGGAAIMALAQVIACAITKDWS